LRKRRGHGRASKLTKKGKNRARKGGGRRYHLVPGRQIRPAHEKDALNTKKKRAKLGPGSQKGKGWREKTQVSLCIAPRGKKIG